MSGSFRSRFRQLAENPDELTPEARLAATIDLAWERAMRWSPETATHVGFEDADHGAWSDESLASIEARIAEIGDPLDVLDDLDRDALSPDAALNYDLFRRNVEDAVAGAAFPSHLMPVDQLNGVQVSAHRTLSSMPTRNRTDLENIFSRLASLPVLVDQTIELLDAGLAAGWTAPRIPIRDVPAQIDNLIGGSGGEQPLLAPLAAFPDAVPEAVRTRVLADARQIYADDVVPAFQRLRSYFAETYLPAARESIAATALPDGEAWYAHNVRVRTTTDLTPQEIHEIGVAEVARIREQMDAVIESVGFEGGFSQFLDHLRADASFYFERPEDLLVAYRDITKRADAELPRLFGLLPRLPYGVTPVPEYAADTQPAAYYLPGSLETGRPGYFFANTSALDERPKWEMEALALHEAVPGHHLQIAIAQELEGLPDFRRHGGYMAYIEGWGLYSESLGKEMGFYRDPYAWFGRLMFEMWRAVRLVVDTGIHALGWTRDRAIEYFREQTRHPGQDIVIEVDRYIVWPGQALSYKVGELKIRELRAMAEAALDGDFDIRSFHDVLLGAGSLPLDILDQRVRNWIAARA